MGKSHDAKKGEKKQPGKTLKEKRLEKKSKKDRQIKPVSDRESGP